MQQNAKPTYIGRFAPSPSGLLHFGSLLSALASYLDAKKNHGIWLLRIDDIDPPREQIGAAENILKTLDAFGLHWDASVIYQSKRFSSYINTCIELINHNTVYPCFCSRKSLSEHSQYPGSCRKQLNTHEKNQLISSLHSLNKQAAQTKHPTTLQPILNNYSLRLVSEHSNLSAVNFYDLIQGEQTIPTNFGDFIILRKDSLPSYMLACGLDDVQDKITHIVRGSDLLEATFWQRYLQKRYAELQKQTINLPRSYAHLPLIVNELQQKLSKQHHAPEIETHNKSELLYLALLALGQKPDKQLQQEESSVILEWAIAHWQLTSIPKQNIAFASLQA